MNRFFLIILTIVSLPVVSCIRNDIPYPEIDAAITSLDADGAKSVSISTDIHEVVLTLGKELFGFVKMQHSVCLY